jgi:hypothetical protein
MKRKPIVRRTIASLIGVVLFSSLAANVNASGFTVTDITDWTTEPGETPNEVVTLDTPFVPYDGGVYAGINTLSLSGAGADDGVYSGFCIDPYHYSVPTSPGYTMDPLTSGIVPKAPGTLNAFTALEIEDLWAMYFPAATTSPTVAAGLQVAIWELVSSNAVAQGQISPADVISFSGNTYGASADIASLATYTGAPADLEGLTGPGQDYVVDIPNANPPPPKEVADGGVTLFMLALSLGALILARPVIIKNRGQLLEARAIPARRRPLLTGRRTGC